MSWRMLWVIYYPLFLIRVVVYFCGKEKIARAFLQWDLDNEEEEDGDESKERGKGKGQTREMLRKIMEAGR